MKNLSLSGDKKVEVMPNRIHIRQDSDLDPDPSQILLTLENQNILLLLTALPVYIVIFLVIVIIFNSLDSIMKFFGQIIVYVYIWMKCERIRIQIWLRIGGL